MLGNDKKNTRCSAPWGNKPQDIGIYRSVQEIISRNFAGVNVRFRRTQTCRKRKNKDSVTA